MKIAYITPSRIDDRNAWSGISHHMANCLKGAGLDVEIIGSLNFPAYLWPARIFRYAAHRAGLAPRHTWLFDPRVLRDYASQLKRQIDRSPGDVIFASGSVHMAFLKSSRPIVYWTDATYASLLNYYFSEDEVDRATVRNGHEVELAAIQNARLGIYSSAWAADSAVREYRMDPQRIEIVPFGANLPQEPQEEEVTRWINDRPGKVCRLFFMGVEWGRKGGDLALAVVQELVKNGLPCELTMAGCLPPRQVSLPDYVKVLGRIDKYSPAGECLLRELFSQSHFFLLPSRADCSPIVFSEANSYGVPILSTVTGGIPSLVREGVNGFCLPIDESLPRRMAERVLETMSNMTRYQALAKTSRQEYVNRLNWKTSGQRVRELLEAL